MKKEFACTKGCVRCCTDAASPPELTLEDIKRMTNALKISVQEFLENCEIVWNKAPDMNVFFPSLALKTPCNFLKDSKCSIYDFRPLHCQVYPELLFLDPIFDLNSSYKCIGAKISESYGRRIMDIAEIKEKEDEVTADYLDMLRYGFRMPDEAMDEIFSVLNKKAPSKNRKAVLRKLYTEKIDKNLREFVEREFFERIAARLARF